MKSNIARACAGLIVILIIVLFNTLREQGKAPTALTIATPSQVMEASSSAVLGIQAKTSGCQVQGALPDKACTPGAVFKDVTTAQVCQRGYSSSVRNVPFEEKTAVYQEYGILTHTTGQYEVDHMISLELGGSNDISNLWPEAADPKPGFHEKDVVENYLHDQMCAGHISMQQAQEEISGQWLSVYNGIPH